VKAKEAPFKEVKLNYPTCLKCGYSLMTNGHCPNDRCENHAHPGGVDILEEMEATVPLFDGKQWCNWRFQAENLTLVHLTPHYEIDLEIIRDSAEMLDWIFQVQQKAWATERDMADLLSAFDDIFEPQASLCSAGQGKTIEPTKFLRERVAPVPAAPVP